eukprot:4659341-Prymnesium_polylepis.2
MDDHEMCRSVREWCACVGAVRRPPAPPAAGRCRAAACSLALPCACGAGGRRREAGPRSINVCGLTRGTYRRYGSDEAYMVLNRVDAFFSRTSRCRFRADPSPGSGVDAPRPRHGSTRWHPRSRGS